MYALDIIPKQINELGQDIGSAWPLFVAIGVAYAGGRKLLSKGRTKMNNELTELVKEQIKPIQEELQHNHGSSMKDAIVRMEKVVNQLAEESGYTQARIRSLIANDTTAHYEIDAEGSLIYVNQAYLSLFGLTKKDAMENKWMDVIIPEDVNRIVSSSMFALTTQSEWADQFTIGRKNDGQQIRVMAKAFPIFKQGMFSGYVGTIVPLSMFETFGENTSA